MRALLPLVLVACTGAKQPSRLPTFMCDCVNDDSQAPRLAVDFADPKAVRVDEKPYVPVTKTLGMAISKGVHRISVAGRELEIVASPGCTHVVKVNDSGLEEEPVCAGMMGVLSSLPPVESIPMPDVAHARDWMAGRIAAIARIESTAAKLVATARRQKDVILVAAAEDKAKQLRALRSAAEQKLMALGSGALSPEEALRGVHVAAAHARQIALELPQVIAVDCACVDWSSTSEGERTEVMIIVAPDDYDAVADPNRVVSAHVFVDDLEVLAVDDAASDPHLDGRLTTVGLLSAGTHSIRATMELAPLSSSGNSTRAEFTGKIAVTTAPVRRVKLAPPALAGSTIANRAARISLTEW